MQILRLRQWLAEELQNRIVLTSEGLQVVPGGQELLRVHLPGRYVPGPDEYAGRIDGMTTDQWRRSDGAAGDRILPLESRKAAEDQGQGESARQRRSEEHRKHWVSV